MHPERRPVFLAASAVVVRPASLPPGTQWFDAVHHLGARGHKYFSQATRYWLAACAALPSGPAVQTRGMVLGTNFGGCRTLRELSAVIAIDPSDLSALTAPNFCLNLIAGVAAIRHGARYCNATTTTPQAGGIDALLTAAGELGRGACDEMFAGAAEDFAGTTGSYLDGAVVVRMTAAAVVGAPALLAHAGAFWPDWDQDPAVLAMVLQRQLGRSIDAGLCTIFSDTRAAGLGASALLPLLCAGTPAVEIRYLEAGHATLEPLLAVLDAIRPDGDQLFLYASASGQVRVLLIAAHACIGLASASNFH